MDDRKRLVREYKQRQIVGGIFKVINSANGRYLLDYTPDLSAKQNSFNFMAGTGVCFDYKIKKDWDTFGAGVFNFEVLETLERGAEQTNEEFLRDLELMTDLWREKLDASLRF